MPCWWLLLNVILVFSICRELWNYPVTDGPWKRKKREERKVERKREEKEKVKNKRKGKKQGKGAREKKRSTISVWILRSLILFSTLSLQWLRPAESAMAFKEEEIKVCSSVASEVITTEGKKHEFLNKWKKLSIRKKSTGNKAEYYFWRLLRHREEKKLWHSLKVGGLNLN